MAVRKVMTFKSGKFIFSDSITTEEINPKLIEYTILYETVRDLPILPALATKFESELIRRSIYSTAAIEGNPLAEEAVGAIITAQGKQDFKNTREKEIGNLTRAYTTVKRMKPINEPYKITEKFVRSIHEVITHDIDSEYNSPGNYRNHLVKVGDKTHGGVYTPPKILPDIQQLMKEYADWINNHDVLNLSPTIRAALAHFHFGLIHPFGDGNGRTARIIEGVILKKAGIKYLPAMLSNYYYTNIDEYFTVFSDARKNKHHDMTGFIDFFLTGCIQSLGEIKRRIIYFIRKFTLRDYFVYLRDTRIISNRQHELLLLLLEKDEHSSFSLKELFNEMPFKIKYSGVSERTARRDLSKLEKMELLKTEGTTYYLNWRSLDAI